MNKVKYKLQKIVQDEIRMAPEGIYNCYVDKEVELTEEELEYMIDYANEYNYHTPDLENKIRKVLE